MRDPQAMLRPDAIADNRATNLNLYPKKRELEKQVRTGLGQDFYRDRHFAHKWQRLAGPRGLLESNIIPQNHTS